MSRREPARTDDSVTSVTDSLRSLMASGQRYAGEMSGLTFLDETSLRSYGPEQILNRMLSTKSYMSTTSSFATRYQDTHENNKLIAFRQIGKGQCGTVWALTGTTKVIKIPNEGKLDQLWNDCCTHKQIEEAFQQTLVALRKDINIPKFVEWIHPSNDLFWTGSRFMFPKDLQPTYGFVSSRIFPLPLPVREAIFEAFAPKSIKANKASFLSDPENKDCLVRLYLGRRAERPSSNMFKLRNFDMMVNELEYLRLDTAMYANMMAHTLAILHWKAKVDANDVEFVLGRSPTAKMPASAAELKSTNPDDAKFLGQDLDFHHRSIGIWLLDFNQCKEFPETADGLKQLERSFYFNDPYYPRPISKHPNDVALWSTFKASYLEASAAITDSDMPKEFITAVEKEGERWRSGRSMFQ